MPMYVREPVPAGVVVAHVVRAFIRKARGRNLRLEVRIVLGEGSRGKALAAECENLTRLPDR